MSDFPNFSDFCEQACRKAWGEPTCNTVKELRWTNGDAYGGKTYSKTKKVWYDRDAQVGGSTLDLVAHRSGEPIEKLSGSKFFDTWQKAHELGYVPDPPPQNERLPIRRTYPYHDERGNLLYEVVRFDTEDKDRRFRQRRPDGGSGWIWSTKGIRRILYRLPELIEGIANDRLVLLCEGEHDAETAHELGYVATTPPEGAEKPWRDEYSETLRGADVIVVADNDDRGRKHADNIARALQGVAQRVRVVMFTVKDLSEWTAAGHTREELDALIDAAPDYVAHDHTPIVPEQNLWPWQFYGRQEIAAARPYLVDKLLPETGVGLISGQWGTYKTFAALDLAAAVITGTPFAGFEVARQGAVLFVAMEGEGEVDPRMRAALTHRGYGEEIAPFAWINTCPRLLDDDAGGQLTDMVKQAAEKLTADFNAPVVLAIIDTAGKAAGYEKAGDENDAVLGRKIVIAMAEASRGTGALLLGVDHFGKTAETGTRGSSAKEADCDVVLALLGDKNMAGEVTNPRLAIRKRRSGANGVEIPFRPRIVQAGDDETTLVFDWLQADQVAPAVKADRWGKALRLLRQTFMNMLADHGTDERPFPDGSTVRAVDIEIVRKEFYSSYPADGDEKQKAATRQKAFKRAIHDAQARGLIGVREVGAVTFIWLARPEAEL